jgi:archaellin
MKTQRLLAAAILVACLAALTLIALSGCAKQTASPGGTAGVTGAAYACPMHPEVQSPKPGECPKCHMKLVKKS